MSHVTVRYKRKIVNTMTRDEAMRSLSASISKLAEGDGPCYEIRDVNSATKQLLTATFMDMNVDLIDKKNGAKKNCNVQIWSQPWLEEGVQVSFECPNEERVVVTHDA
ncbi:sarcocystatin-A-like isoform X2 [Eurosta solidaginis]|uniref:sarcocystatin-A-like isoform X2 n=1 Tax=Eurosta solidaginis TaxID=178769 RepID=UPI00353101DB